MRTISEYMRLEHKHLLALYEGFVQATSREDIQHSFKNFSTALRSHIRLEEEYLSPSFNKHLGTDKEKDQTTHILIDDHIKITKLLNNLKIALDVGDAQRIAYAEKHFIRALEKHHKREEELHYTLFDTIFSEKEWLDILSHV